MKVPTITSRIVAFIRVFSLGHERSECNALSGGAGLRYNGDATAAGAQTERRGGAGEGLPGREDSPAACSLFLSYVCGKRHFIAAVPAVAYSEQRFSNAENALRASGLFPSPLVGVG